MLPQMTPYSSKHIKKGGLLFVIPCCLLKRDIPSRMEALSKESDQAVESKKTWGRPLDRRIGPLALGLYSQVGTTLLKGDFSTPAFHEVDHDGKARLLLISGEVSSWV